MAGSPHQAWCRIEVFLRTTQALLERERYVEALTLLLRLTHIKFCVGDANHSSKFQVLTVRENAAYFRPILTPCLDAGHGWLGALAQRPAAISQTDQLHLLQSPSLGFGLSPDARLS